ncbi:MAG: hypothetical protein OXH09_12285 [Gammaproteobacteria bacterium]|nr:hypothetical protein [Gammaproteobacteria bacterium]
MGGRYLPRTCAVVGEVEEKHHPLVAFRDRDAFVLLAAPGAGKTRAFKHEAHDVQGCYITARNFLTLPVRPEWRETTLFIDGLDERRAGSSDQRTPLDEIRAKLDSLGKPRFRLSCREADWFGANDRSHLAMVAPGGEVTELRLDPLTEEDSLRLLRQLGVGDLRVFVAKARGHGLDALMGNPQALEMLARSVASGGEWPTTRMGTFERSCRELAKELNREHQLAGRPQIGTPELLDAAGRLCAVCLLTGAAGYAEFEGDRDLLPLSGFRTPVQEVLQVVCRTSLFEKDDRSFAPRHRQIAEFLGGRYLAGLVADGLPSDAWWLCSPVSMAESCRNCVAWRHGGPPTTPRRGPTSSSGTRLASSSTVTSRDFLSQRRKPSSTDWSTVGGSRNRGHGTVV